MITREWIDLFRVLHGAYNTLVALAFLYQGWLGLKIRKAEKSGDTKDFGVIKRHRGNGPVLVLLGILGYLAGATLIYIDKGHFSSIASITSWGCLSSSSWQPHSLSPGRSKAPFLPGEPHISC